jgi:hypothetical protein
MLTHAVAELATALYASVYIAWFAGNIHSTYATELFFPVLMVLFILRHREHNQLKDLIGASVAFALAAGFRPSDGFFLGPLFLVFVVRYLHTWRQRALTLSLACIFCVAWLIPNQLALRNFALHDQGAHTSWTQLRSVAPFRTFRTEPSVKTVDLHSSTIGPARLILTNALRVVFPLTLAFWPLAPWLFRRDELRECRTLVWLWILPGLSFFLLVFMSDAVYLCYLLGGVVLLACIGTPTRMKLCALTLCIAFNMGFYLTARPIMVTSAITAVFDVYGAKYTYWSVRNQYFKNLKDVYPPDRLGPGGAK